MKALLAFLCTTTLAVAGVLTATPAQAATRPTPDARGDVAQTHPSGWPLGARVPARANGDIVNTRVTLTRGGLVAVLKFRKLARDPGSPIEIQLAASEYDGEDTSFYLNAFAGPRDRWRGVSHFPTEEGHRNACPNRRVRFDYRHRTVRLSVPASCFVYKPRKISLSILVLTGRASTGRFADRSYDARCSTQDNYCWGPHVRVS